MVGVTVPTSTYTLTPATTPHPRVFGGRHCSAPHVLQGNWPLSYVEGHLGTASLSKSEVIDYLRHYASPAFLQRWKLMGTSRNIRKTRNCQQLIAAYKVSMTASICSLLAAV